MNEKYTKTITQVLPAELLWSARVGKVAAVDVVSGFVLWTYPMDGSSPTQREPANRRGLPGYCTDLLDLDETDPHQVCRYHERYGPYWEYEVEASRAGDSTRAYGYPLARFQCEVQLMRAGVALATGLRNRDRQAVIREVCRTRHIESVTAQLMEKRRKTPTKWRTTIAVDASTPSAVLSPGRWVVRSRWSPPIRYSDSAIDLRLGWLPLRPSEWQSVHAAWLEAPREDSLARELARCDDDGLLEFCMEQLWECLAIPAIRPYLWLDGTWRTPRIWLSLALFRGADFVRLAIAQDIARGLLPTRCASESCQRYFLPTRPRQVYCSKECQRAQAVRRHRRRAKSERRR